VCSWFWGFLLRLGFNAYCAAVFEIVVQTVCCNAKYN
jgi:hypothetical protein